MIEMAKKKGMTDSPVIEDPRGLPNDTTKHVFDDWDTNNDGFIDVDEVTTCTNHAADKIVYVINDNQVFLLVA